MNRLTMPRPRRPVKAHVSFVEHLPRAGRSRLLCLGRRRNEEINVRSDAHR
jgi:hypothetical protein